MINETRKLYLLLILIVALTSACSMPPESASSSADSNTAQAASGAQSGTPQATSPTGQNPSAQKDPVTPAPAQPEATTVKNEDGPKIEVPVKKIDFGEQLEGKTVTRSFLVKNKGKKTLEISAVDASCGCTTVDFPKTIAPGREKAITVKVNIGNVEGEHVKTVTIKSNDPETPAFIVELAFTTKKITR